MWSACRAGSSVPPRAERRCAGCRFRRPRPFVLEPDGIDHQGVAFPVAQFFAEERRVGIFGMFSLRIDGDQAIVAVEIEERDLFAPCSTSKGRPLALWRGMPPRMHRLSGSMVAVTLCFQAASPAGVSGSFNPGRSLAMLPSGVVARAFPIAAEVGMAVGGAGRRRGEEGGGPVAFARPWPAASLTKNRLQWRRSRASRAKEVFFTPDLLTLSSEPNARSIR